MSTYRISGVFGVRMERNIDLYIADNKSREREKMTPASLARC